MIVNNIYFHTAPYKIECISNKLPEPAEEYVSVKYLFCGICGGDYSAYCGYRTEYPVSLGHEFIAKVIQTGDMVNDLSIGDFVVSDFNYRCGSCIFCKQGKSHLCIQNNIQRFSNRGFAEYANIHYKYLQKIPTFSFLPQACLIEPLSCVIHACSMLTFTNNTPIIVNGCGSIGMLCVFFLTRVLKHSNIKIIEKNPEKKAKILSHFSVKEYDEHEIISNVIIIECTNSLEGAKYSLDICAPGDTICIMSHLYGLNTSYIYETICKKELISIFPLRNGQSNNLKMASKYIKEHWTDNDNDMIEVYENAAEAFKQKASATSNKQVVQLFHE